jgi:hypothetical protein
MDSVTNGLLHFRQIMSPSYCECSDLMIGADYLHMRVDTIGRQGFGSRIPVKNPVFWDMTLIVRWKPSDVSEEHVCYVLNSSSFLRFFFDPEDGGYTFLRKPDFQRTTLRYVSAVITSQYSSVPNQNLPLTTLPLCLRFLFFASSHNHLHLHRHCYCYCHTAVWGCL